MDQPKGFSIGQYMLDKITSTSLFRIENAGENHIIVWSSGAVEQLEAIAVEAIELDFKHNMRKR